MVLRALHSIFIMLRLSFAVVLSVFLAAVAGISQQATSSEGVGLHDRQQDIVSIDCFVCIWSSMIILLMPCLLDTGDLG